MANKLLAISPTRQRPQQCKRMYESFKETSVQSDIIFCADLDDPTLKEYEDCLKDSFTLIHIWERRTTTELYNQVFKDYPDYEFYCETADDYVFRTPGWDEKLCQKGKICYGNDLLAGASMPTCPVIDGDIVRALGWLQMPTLQHLYPDNVWKTIGMRLGILQYFPEVIIEHFHWMNHKSEVDDVYKKSNSAEMYKKDAEAFEQWKRESLESDLQKIRAKLEM